MSNEKKLVPRLRFEEFKDSREWNHQTLGDLGTVAMNKRIFKNQTLDKGEVPFYKIGTFGKEPDSYISYELFNKYKSKYSYPKIGDILISASGSIGRTVEYGGEDEYFQDSNIVWLEHSNEISNQFLKQFYKIVKWSGLEGSTIKRLYNKNILNTDVILPNIEEQEKIGNFFKKLDELIQLQESKIDKVKAIKSAYLSEMFPKEGEKYPKKRFKGFTEPWKKRKLDSIANNFDMLRIPVTAADRIPGDTPYYGANGIQDYVEGHTHDGEYILLAEDGANDLKNYPVHFVNGKVWVNNHAHVLQGNTGVLNNKFLMYNIKTIDMEPYLVGGGRAKLNANIMMNIELLLPNLEEQEKIGNFFKNLDDQISVEEEKLEKLEKIKEAYLDDLFV